MQDDPGQQLLVHGAPPGLLDRALTRQPATSHRRRLLAMAAVFVLGVLLGRGSAPPAAPVLAQAPDQVESLTPVRLVYHADHATTVGVAGSWNNWEPEPMQGTTEDGLFFTVVVLPPGRHEYMFVIDGEQWLSDPTALLTHDDGFGQRNAVLQIGA